MREYSRRYRANPAHAERERVKRRERWKRKGSLLRHRLKEPQTLSERCAALRWGRAFAGATAAEAAAERVRHHAEWVDAVLQLSWQDQRGSERVQRASPARG